MTARRHPFEYAVLQVVPRPERGEAVNAAVMVYCRALRYLDARIHVDPDRLRLLDPAVDPAAVERALQSVADVCVAAPHAGPAARQDIGERFRWLTAPRSTVVRPGPVHTGLTVDPAAEIERLLRLLVLPVSP